MDRRVAAAVVALGWVAVGTAAAQPSPPPGVRPDPAAFLLPPVASPEPGDRPPDRPFPPAPHGSDLPAPEPRSAPPADRPPAARFATPRDITPVSAQTVEDAGKPDAPSAKRLSGSELFDYLDDFPRAKRGVERSSSGFGGKLGDKFRDAVDGGRRKGWFESDHAFDCMVSPVTNPFLFEDPRALTEVRPIFIYQKIPSPQPNFNGGSIYFYGTQARVAFGDRFSVVINKLGGMTLNSGPGSPYGDHTGFAELWLGPKVTIIRDEEFGTLLAAGATFQIPLGSANVFQNTGKLSIVPYVSGAQRFLQTRLGAFNALASAGYSISVDHARSDYFYASGHLDYDIANAHRIFPLVELNWFQYTTNGTSNLIAGEGRDLINFGSLAKGSSLLTGAVGLRVKPTRNTEVGGAFEVPLAGNRDFFRYRFTIDFIWRY